jgi:hypothetical protein
MMMTRGLIHLHSPFPRRLARAVFGAVILGASAFVIASPAHAAGFQASLIYGNSGVDGNFYKFFTGTGPAGTITPTLLFNPRTVAGTTVGAGTTFNGLALDSTNKRLFYREETGSTRLLVYDQTTGVQRVVTGNAPLPGVTTDAAFFAGSYWYVGNNAQGLARVNFNFSNPNAPTYTVTVFNNFDGTPRTSFNFGDIAISSGGLLYGNTTAGKDFEVQLVNAGTVANPNWVPSSSSYKEFTATPETGLQTAFSFDSSVIFGTGRPGVTGANANLYKINPTTNASTQIGQFAGGQWFRDLGGSTLIEILPEPGTGPLVLLGGLALVPLIRRRTSRKRGSDKQS